MTVQSIESLLPKSGNSVYRLVRMAANRALELAEGKKRPRVSSIRLSVMMILPES